MIIRVLFVFVILLCITGCGSGVRFVRMDETKYPARAKNSKVETFPESTSKPYVVIGTLHTEKDLDASFGGKSIYDETIDALKSYARRVGADALINLKPRHVGEGSDNKVIVDATAVRYLEAGQVVTSGGDPETTAP